MHRTSFLVMVAYLFLLLSSVCSLLLVHLLKIAEVKNLRTVNILTVNYLVAGVIAFVLGWWKKTDTTGDGGISLILLLFCIAAGVLFIGNYFAYSKSVHMNGMGISIASMRLSLLVPVLVSVFLYGEFLSNSKILGIALAVGALLLLVPRGERIRFGQMDAGWLLLIVFIFSGLADASLKVYREEFSIRLNEMLFMSIVLAGAFGVGLAICFTNSSGKALFVTEEWKLGALIGVPNLYASVFLIYSLESMSGAVAFPLVNILNVLGGTMLGLLRWGDQITGWQWTGIAVAAVAIILLL